MPLSSALFIQLAHNPNIHVVAEGVETGEQAATLQALDCDFAQGYMLSMPLPPAHAESFILSGANRSTPVPI
jgi:EAL domain-containing protein (putative c-di-GMP-specific phosphodiesterase class I)